MGYTFESQVTTNFAFPEADNNPPNSIRQPLKVEGHLFFVTVEVITAEQRFFSASYDNIPHVSTRLVLCCVGTRGLHSWKMPLR